MKIRLPEAFRERVEGGVRGVVINEELPEFFRHEAGGFFFFEDEVDDVLAGERSGFPEDGLVGGVPLAGAVGDLAVGRIQIVAGERARGLADVPLGVVALAEGEELHDLAGEIFVRHAFFRALGVEVKHHRRVQQDGLREVLEAAEGALAEQLVLQHQKRRLFHLLDRGGEVVVPEEGHFLAQRSLGLEHPAEPPGLAFEGLAAAFLLDRLLRLASLPFRPPREGVRALPCGSSGFPCGGFSCPPSACSAVLQAGTGNASSGSVGAISESTALSRPRA